MMDFLETFLKQRDLLPISIPPLLVFQDQKEILEDYQSYCKTCTIVAIQTMLYLLRMLLFHVHVIECESANVLYLVVFWIKIWRKDERDDPWFFEPESNKDKE